MKYYEYKLVSIQAMQWDGEAEKAVKNFLKGTNAGFVTRQEIVPYGRLYRMSLLRIHYDQSGDYETVRVGDYIARFDYEEGRSQWGVIDAQTFSKYFKEVES